MTNFKWWQTSIIYQIYPRSFQDSNNDGIGDIPGIIKRLDYLREIGIKSIWISPFYPSPMKDFGYDISDYKGIHPIFGIMKDFDRLLDEAHKRDIKIIIDLVPNHTSDQHPWFLESRKSKDNPYRDYYIWKDSKKNGKEPNNWLSYFGGSAWEWDRETQQYYLHQFVKEQPDLNYANPKVLKEILDIIDFWLAKGVDGFRVDVICNMWKHPDFPNNPKNPKWTKKLPPFEKYLMKYNVNQPEVHAIVRKMRKVLDKYKDRVLIGETYLPYKGLLEFYGNNDECHLPFNFHLLGVKWKAPAIKKKVNDYEKILPENCWPSYVLGNHDQKRIATKIGSEKQARIANMLLLTLRGSPTVYYGEEICMKNVKIPKSLIQDPPALNQPDVADIVGRDPERTPMQWDDSPNAGFSAKGVKTWLPLAKDYKTNNVEIQKTQSNSMLALFKSLTKLRSEYSCLNSGKYKYIPTAQKDIFAYLRYDKNNTILVVLNFSQKFFKLDLSKKLPEKNGKLLLASDLEEHHSTQLSSLNIKAHLGLIIEIE
ncbi:MAG TPA: alpha-amylase [Lentisphaeria bacterium]|nr:MAG: alpha-amylase [Lentisphaerae bacterium GWF2_38_69]HBM17119.1 alpha-amylase [Lentisphaeria bacterium]